MLAARAARPLSGSIAANSLALLSAQIVSKVLGLALVITAARVLGVESYGQFTLAFAFAAFFAPLLEFGMELPATRAVVLEPQHADEVLGATLLARALLAGAVLPVAGVAAVVLPGGPAPGLLAFALLSAHGMALLGSYLSVFRGWQRMDLEAYALIVMRGITVGLSVLLAWRGGGVLAVGSAHAIGALAGLALAARLASAQGLRPSWRQTRARARQLLRAGAPFVLTALLVAVYFRVDSLLLAALQGDRSVGLYGCATHLMLSMMLFSQALVLPLVPVVASARDLADPRARPALRGALVISAIAGAAIALATALLGPIALRLLYGEPYVAAARALSILMAGLPVLYTTNLLGHCLGALGRQRLVLAVAALNAATNVALNLVLIPWLDFEGAALATLLTEVIGLAAFACALRRELSAVLAVAAPEPQPVTGAVP